ncbi:MAG: zinc metalloprotease ZmpB, partial [Actinomycetota bacterium]|nr:zinc metalloprotease ZmpB [Actinomycetota bacterium]
MKTSPFRVLSSQSTQHPDVRVDRPNPDVVKRAEALDAGQLTRGLGLSPVEGPEQPERYAVVIERRRLVVYRYEADRVQRDGPPSVIFLDRAGNGRTPGARMPAEAPAADGLVGVDESSLPWLPLPPVPDAIREGQHYVGVKVDFTLALAAWGELHWTAILDVDSLAVLYLRPHVDDVSGLVFDVDPVTTNGGPLPSANNAALNPIRVSESLVGLVAPSGGVQSLTGDNITVVDDETPVVAPPTEPGSTNFDFDARTDNFSAVNAYVHCDRFFRLVASMGFPRSSYFGGTTFPTPADHRGHMGTTSGLEINAHCVGTTGGAGIARTTFALADTGDTANPIGIADDFRVVLHELGGHGVLYNHVSSANFGFSHSAGDSVAAILNDPGSQAPDRFLTFPWLPIISRRHDRLPSGGWGWAGTIGLNPFGSSDGGGYNNEQILSSTMFRLYRSLGGDSTDVNTQRFAARMTVYLILRAIGTLTPATNPANPAGFETALETADSGDWVSENITGGAYRKVIRWAFEKQGLFQPAGTATPNNNVGAAPAVDVYIDDGRAGEYQYQPVFWDNQNIWNRTAADGGTTHQDPITNQTNFAYVKIKNRGSQAATSVVVKAFHANPAAGLSYPNDWIPMTTSQLAVGNIAPNNAAEIVAGPFSWTPTHVGHECMFMIVSASGDGSNVGNIAAGDSIPEWRLVPHDNNIGQRNVAPVPGAGTSGLTEEFNGLSFEVKNPLTAAAVMQIEPKLPSLLAERDWQLAFTNRGGPVFKLAAGESREVVMRLVKGSDFTAADVEGSADRTIQVAARADGILVGGMSYQLDPKLKRPQHGGHGNQGEPEDEHEDHNPRPGEPGHVHDANCGCRTDERIDGMAETLLRQLTRRNQRVREVEIRKVLVEIELEDCDE